MNHAYAEDKMEYLGFQHSDNPNICIMEPEPELQERFHSEIFKTTVDAILVFQNDMQEYSDGNWTMPIFYHEYETHMDKWTDDFPECNIFIEYREYNNGEDGTTNKKALGYTSFDFSKSWHKWSYIMVYLEASSSNPHVTLCIGCEDKDITIELKREPLSVDTITRIVQHELGHGLGMGHYMIDQLNHLKIPSLMYPSMDPFEDNNYEIQSIDKEMILYIYGDDGFGGKSGKVIVYDVSVSELQGCIEERLQ